MRLSSILALIFSFLFSHSAFGQQYFILNTEVGGKVFVFGSVSLESYWEKAQFGVGLGAGFNSLSNSNQLIRDSLTNDLIEFRSSEIKIPLTAYVYKAFGNAKNRLIVPIGFTTLMDLQRSDFRGERSLEIDEMVPLPFAGIGYELHGEKVIFRLPAYALYLGDDPNNIFPDILPWLGLGFGFRLGE